MLAGGLRLQAMQRNRGPNDPQKVTIWLPQYARLALKEEAARRDMTMGAIILEALTSRIMFFDSKKEGEK